MNTRATHSVRRATGSDAEVLAELRYEFRAENRASVETDREFVLLARVYAGQGNDTNAWATVQKALQYNSDSVPAFIFEGELYVKAGNKDQAKLAYQKALDLDPKNDQAKQGLEALG